MTSRSRIPLLHTVITAVAALFYLIYLCATGYCTATWSEIIWHYALGAAGIWGVYMSVLHLTDRRGLALGVALVWAISPATMGVNGTAGLQGPIMALSALCLYGLVRLYRSGRTHSAHLIIIGILGGAGLNLLSYIFTGSSLAITGSFKETVIDILYTRSECRPGWCGDPIGACLSVPWLVIAWIYVISIVRILRLWHQHNPRAGILTTVCLLGLAGGPYAAIASAFVSGGAMLAGSDGNRDSFFTKRAALAVCMGIIVVWGTILTVTEGPVWFGDSQSYYSAANQLSAGQIDLYRTPLYPLLLMTAVKIFGPGCEWAVIVLQFIGLWVSAVILYRMILLIWPRPIGSQGAFWVTLLYGIGAPTASMCTVIGTESLATVFLVVCAYSMTLLWMHGLSLPRLLWLTISLLMMVALRPAMMYMVAAAGIFSVVAVIAHRRPLALASFGTVVFVSITVLSYCAVVQRHTGVFTPSLVGTVNRYADMAYSNPSFDGITTRQPAVLTDVKATGFDSNGAMLVWAAPMYIDRHGTEAVTEFLTDVEAVRGDYIREAKFNRLTARHDTRPMMVRNSLLTYMSAALLTVPFSIVILLLVVWPWVAMVRKRRIRIIPTLLYICVVGNVLAVVIGAPDATARLLAPSSPLLLYLGADLLLMIKHPGKIKPKPQPADSFPSETGTPDNGAVVL